MFTRCQPQIGYADPAARSREAPCHRYKFISIARRVAKGQGKKGIRQELRITHARNV